MKNTLILTTSLMFSLAIMSCSSPENPSSASYSPTPTPEIATKDVSEEDNKPESDPVPTESADEHYISFLLGNEKDENGDFFWGISDDIEYALLDLNNDGQNELIVRSFGSWIPDIIEYKDSKVSFAGVFNAGSSGLTIINSNDQFVSADSHEGRKQYWISSIDSDGNAVTTLYFSKMWGDWAENPDKPDFFKSYNPSDTDFSTDDCEKISEEEFTKLEEEYTQEKSNIDWKTLAELRNNTGSLTSEGSSSPEGDSNNATNDSEINAVLKAYDEYIRNNYKSEYGDVRIALIYLNEDDIPEAIIEQDGDIEWSIVGYENNAVKFIEGCVIDSLYYTPKENLFYYDWCDGESTGTVIGTIKGIDVSIRTIDEVYTEQGTEYYYSDGKTTNQISEAQVKEILSEVKDCVKFSGSFAERAEDAYGLLNQQ